MLKAFESDLSQPTAYLSKENFSQKNGAYLKWLAPLIDRRPASGQDRMALLVVDVQDFFFSPASPSFLPVAPLILPQIEELIGCFQERELPVLFTRHIDEADSPMVRWWGRELERDSPWTKLSLSPGSSSVIEKSHYNAFEGTALGQQLNQLGVRQLVIVGALTHLCVDTTVRSAFSHHFAPVLPIDAIGSKNEALHLGALASLAHGFAHVVDTKGIKAWIRR